MRVVHTAPELGLSKASGATRPSSRRPTVIFEEDRDNGMREAMDHQSRMALLHLLYGQEHGEKSMDTPVGSGDRRSL